MTITRRTLLALTGLAFSVSAMPVFAQDASSLERIKQSNELRIGVTSAEPWFFKDPMTEVWAGVGVAMGEKLAERLGVTLVPVETTWANAVAAIQANQIDLMFVLDPTEERKKAIDFPEAPLFYYAMGALVSEDSDVKTWDDLDKSGTRIGVTLGTSLDKNITEMAKNAEISRFSNNDEAIAAFAARRVDAVVQFHPALVVQFSRLKLGKVILPTPVNPVPTSAGMRKEADSSFRNFVSEQFAALYKDGVPDQVFEAYLKTKTIDPTGIPGLIKEAWQ